MWMALIIQQKLPVGECQNAGFCIFKNKLIVRVNYYFKVTYPFLSDCLLTPHKVVRRNGAAFASKKA